MAKEKLPSLTNWEAVTLTAVGALGEANNVEIFDAVLEVCPDASFPTVYTALVRMTFRGYVAERTGESQPVRGGKARKYFKLTAQGERVLAATHDIFRASLSMWKPARVKG
jgi:DNA-binding PadR family transcriptional regulator